MLMAPTNPDELTTSNGGHNRPKRNKIACDECHARRVKCDSANPCFTCHQSNVVCTYLRPRSKRGGASLKQQANRVHRQKSRARDRIAAANLASPVSIIRQEREHVESDDRSPKSVPISSILNEGDITAHSAGLKNDGQFVSHQEYVYGLATVPIRRIKYPILGPVMHGLDFLTPSVACDLLETYFDKPVWGNTHILRRSSILATDSTKVRNTRPVLIYAMLCFAARRHDSSCFEALTSNKSEIVDRLFELTLSSLVLLQNLKDEATLDDVMSYIQLASMLSASKYQKKSIEWWSATYQLAKQLRLNEESTGDISEEEKEERRRTWWLLYCVDRHQALSVRKSLSFRDAECQDLLRPSREDAWNAGTFTQDPLRKSGIVYRVTDCSFFGIFIPLMTIVGEIIELVNLLESNTKLDIDPKKKDIEHHLDTFDQSLSECKFHSLETELLKCYARHALSTVHILFAGKWDPLDILTDVEASGLSQEIIYSAAMATIAANTVNEIQVLDQDFEFLPLFFGLFLLQCSFPLLLVMKAFGAQSDENIVRGCEFIMKAHKVSSKCNEQQCQSVYWTNFEGVIADIKSRLTATTGPDEAVQTMQDINGKVREILGLYRWNKTGHGVNT